MNLRRARSSSSSRTVTVRWVETPDSVWLAGPCRESKRSDSPDIDRTIARDDERVKNLGGGLVGPFKASRASSYAKLWSSRTPCKKCSCAAGEPEVRNSTSPNSDRSARRSPPHPVVPATKASTMATVLRLIHRLISDLQIRSVSGALAILYRIAAAGVVQNNHVRYCNGMERAF